MIKKLIYIRRERYDRSKPHRFRAAARTRRAHTSRPLFRSRIEAGWNSGPDHNEHHGVNAPLPPTLVVRIVITQARASKARPSSGRPPALAPPRALPTRPHPRPHPCPAFRRAPPSHDHHRHSYPRPTRRWAQRKPRTRARTCLRTGVGGRPARRRPPCPR